MSDYHDTIRAILGLSDVTPAGKVVLIYLFDRQGQNGHSWPALTTICHDCELSRPTVSKAIRNLEKLKLLTVKRPEYPSVIASNHYTLTGKKTLPVKNFNQSKKITRTSKNPLPEPVKKINPNDSLTDSLTTQNNNSGNFFKKPTPDEVREYANSIGFTELDAEQFCNFYEAKGWMIGKNKMKDWKAAVRTWRKNHTPKTPAAHSRPVAQSKSGFKVIEVSNEE